MNGFLLIIPLLLIRYVLLYVLDKKSLKRAAFIPPMFGIQKALYWIYQISTLSLVFYPFFLRIRMTSLWLFGLVLYGVGAALCFISTFNFARPTETGINRKGLYRVSRNPMYTAYFIYFLGCAFLTRSLILLMILAVFQISTHWIILSEEEWCKERYGDEYIQYMKKVRRYM